MASMVRQSQQTRMTEAARSGLLAAGTPRKGSTDKLRSPVVVAFQIVLAALRR